MFNGLPTSFPHKKYGKIQTIQPNWRLNNKLLNLNNTSQYGAIETYTSFLNSSKV